MLKNLVIVESPAKAKTIEKFLGKDFKVMSSRGHIRDLGKKNIGIDIENGFAPVYEVPDDKQALVDELRRAASQAQTVWLASDEDREGEAIAWHLAEVLELDPGRTRRIVFHEITKEAILNAIENPRTIDRDRVDAQQARRVLDRIVGFELSPVLWKKIKLGLSAGRVQSVAVRLIVDREEEIKNFVAEPYVRVTGDFAAGGDGRANVHAELSKRLPDPQTAQKFLEDCRTATFSVTDVQKKPVKKSPAPPFTTSTLQQEAARKLGFTVAQTMRVAQTLYESGHITYMRTDSLNLSSLAINTISKEITANMGAPYLKIRQYHTHSKGAQEAHEAIRPTYIDRHDIAGTAAEKRLYQLIWKRTVASQMADAEIEKTTATIGISDRPEHFTATGEVIRFDGFLRVYAEGTDDENSETAQGMLPALAPGQNLAMCRIDALERFTQQPPRYTEASLVKKLEELGIGRPSTYAPTISTIQQREYIEKSERPGTERTITRLTLTPDGQIATASHTENAGADKGKLMPTDIGTVVNRYLTQNFPDILDYNFTASIEEKFDDIAQGQLPWSNEIADFYASFHPGVQTALESHTEHKAGERLLGTEPQTGQPVFVKIGRFGPLVQIGANDSDQKPRFASLQKGQSIETITLDEALKLFSFPRDLGTYREQPVSVAIGRFGPYVRLGKTYASIPRDINPAGIDFDTAVRLVLEKEEKAANRIVKTFDEDPDIQVLNGRFGVYISAGGKNHKLPASVTDPKALTLDQCRAIIAAQPQARKTATRKTAAKKTATAKTGAARKTKAGKK